MYCSYTPYYIIDVLRTCVWKWSKAKGDTHVPMYSLQVQYRYRTGAVQVQYRNSTGTVQVQYRYRTGAVQVL